MLNSDFRNRFSTKGEYKVESRDMILSTQDSAVDSALELETILIWRIVICFYLRRSVMEADQANVGFIRYTLPFPLHVSGTPGDP